MGRRWNQAELAHALLWMGGSVFLSFGYFYMSITRVIFDLSILI